MRMTRLIVLVVTLGASAFLAAQQDITGGVPREPVTRHPHDLAASYIRMPLAPEDQKYGALNDNRWTFFPIFDWTKQQTIDAIRDSGVKLPIDYKLFGRSFDGLDWRFMKPLKEHLPDDYAKVVEWFPMVELEVKRIEWREAYYRREAEKARQLRTRP